MPSGLPGIKMPSLDFRDVDGVIPLAFACFLLAYIESVSAAKTLADKGGYEINTRQELLAWLQLMLQLLSDTVTLLPGGYHNLP